MLLSFGLPKRPIPTEALAMKQHAAQLLEQALRLPDQERADMAVRLLESLESIVDEDVDSEWNAEIQQRLHEIDSGKAKLVSWQEARRMIQEPGDAASES
jgi:putative addiction module component (TIGR02574 family)